MPRLVTAGDSSPVDSDEVTSVNTPSDSSEYTPETNILNLEIPRNFALNEKRAKKDDSFIERHETDTEAVSEASCAHSTTPEVEDKVIEQYKQEVSALSESCEDLRSVEAPKAVEKPSIGGSPRPKRERFVPVEGICKWSTGKVALPIKMN